MRRCRWMFTLMQAAPLIVFAVMLDDWSKPTDRWAALFLAFVAGGLAFESLREFATRGAH